MSIPRTLRVHAAVLVLSLVAANAQAASATASMSVGLTLRAPGDVAAAPQREGVVNAMGQMRMDGAETDAVERAIAQAPRVERAGERLADGSRIHSIQF